MENERGTTWRPNWTVTPGEVLLEALDERDMTQTELSRRTARPLKTINEIVQGKAAVTPETAIQFERVLGIPASFWVRLDARYRESLARERDEQSLLSSTSWADEFPVAELRRHGLVSKTTSKARLVEELLQFFGVANVAAFETQWLGARVAFRSSPAFASSPTAVAAWLRWGQIEAQRTEREQFDPTRVPDLINRLRPLSRTSPALVALAKVKELCAAYGIALVLTPELKGTHVSGACYWTKRGPVVHLSLRHGTDDQFWFSLFHELGHIVRGHRRPFLDSDQNGSVQTSDEDRDADAFARDALIDATQLAQFVAQADFSEKGVRAFAKSLGVSAGIVVGRLQHDGVLDKRALNSLKQPLTWAARPR